MPLSPGLTIAPNLRLSHLLGEGGMGSIWAADHLTLQTQVAVKFVSAGLAGDRGVLARFSREATSAAQIKSPHVVQIFDHGVYEDLPYIVMELLEGEDLEHRLARDRALGLEETAQIVQQTCKALTAAHALGIIHRDIKPANLFLASSAGETFVKLLDFGIAKRAAGDPSLKTSTGALVGTPFYMSYEQVFSQAELDFRSDLWSIAVVAYECLTGRRPFEGDTPGNLFVAIHTGTYRLPSSFPGLPGPELDRWFARAFAREPARRFGSAKELSDTFGAIVAATTHDRLPVKRLASSLGAQADAMTPWEHPTLLSAEKSGPFAGAPASPSRTARRRKVALAVLVGAVCFIGSAATTAALFLRAQGARGASSAALGPPSSATSAPAPSASAPPSAGPGGAEPEPLPPAAVPASSAPSATDPIAAPPKRAPSAPAKSTSAAPAKSAAPAPKRRDHGF